MIEIDFLGTGTSAGVPMIGCDCAVCHSDDPRDRRDRPSILIRYDQADAGAGDSSHAPWDGSRPEVDDDQQQLRHVLIDTAPELRQQAIRHNLHHLDAIFFTHAHADHIFGLDDVRRFNAVMKAPLDIYGEAEVLQRLRQMFKYIFESSHNANPSFVADLITHPIEPETPMTLLGATWTPIRLLHGRLPILGYRIDLGPTSIAYCTDVSRIPPQTYPLLENLDVLILDALRYRHHPTHMSVDQALEQIEAINPESAYLTHIAHDIEHAQLEPNLPEHVQLAYDGLTLHCDARRNRLA